MPSVKVRASTILSEFEQAQPDLVGKAVILTDGKAGTVEGVWLDEFHASEFRSGGTMESGLSQGSNSRSRMNSWRSVMFGPTACRPSSGSESPL
jgi:hypothetical protein